MKVNEDTREEIVRYLRPKDVKNLSLASPDWKKFLDKPKYWRRFKIFLTEANYKEVLTSDRLMVTNRVAIWYKTNGQYLLEKVKEMIDQQETGLSKLVILIDPWTFSSSEVIQFVSSIERVRISWEAQSPESRRMCKTRCRRFVYELMAEIKRGSGRLKILSLDSWKPSGSVGLYDSDLFAAAITKLTVFKYYGKDIETDHLRALFEAISKDPDQINLRGVYLGVSPPVWIQIMNDLHGEYCQAKKYVRFAVKK